MRDDCGGGGLEQRDIASKERCGSAEQRPGGLVVDVEADMHVCGWSSIVCTLQTGNDDKRRP
jgi:hypothetical protein